VETSGHGAGQLDFVVACWMVPVRLAACFCGMLGAGLGCCLLDGAWAPGYLLLWNAFPVECFCGLWLLPRNVLPLKFLSVDE